VSVGSAGNFRQITNVANATDPNDAVNLFQLNQVHTILDTRINKLGAMETAIGMATASAAGIASENRLAVGYGHKNGENAFSIAYQRLLTPNSTLTLGGAFSNGENTFGAGVGVGW
jgi:autotransporter adhesin